MTDTPELPNILPAPSHAGKIEITREMVEQMMAKLQHRSKHHGQRSHTLTDEDRAHKKKRRKMRQASQRRNRA